jgi:hypothetical protein
MNGKVARFFRQTVYKKTPRRGKRMYKRAGNGAIVVVGPRREYQELKRQYKIWKRGER